MRGEFTGLLLLLTLAVGFPLLLRGASRMLSPGESTRPPDTDAEARRARVPLPVSFTLASLLFLLALPAIAFVLPWAALARELGGEGLLAIGVFAAPLLVGVLYGWRKRSFEW